MTAWQAAGEALRLYQSVEYPNGADHARRILSGLDSPGTSA